MAHHKNAKKQIRKIARRNEANRYYGKTSRNATRKLLNLESKSEATAAMPNVISMIDKLAKRNQIHKKRAANMKSLIMRRINALA